MSKANAMSSSGFNNAAMRALIDMLPEYRSPSWHKEPDNLRCDVAFVKQALLRLVDDACQQPTNASSRGLI